MEEKILSTRKNGMAVLLGCIGVEVLALLGMVYGIASSIDAVSERQGRTLWPEKSRFRCA